MAIYKNILTALLYPNHELQEAHWAIILALVCTLYHAQNYTPIASINSKLA